MSFRIDFRRSLDEEIRRIASEEMAAIAALLETSPDGRQRSIHNARKRVKRVRGLIKLIRPAAPGFHDTENRRFRDFARALAPARDADALVETADRLLAGDPAPREAAQLSELRAYLRARRDRLLAQRGDIAVDEALSTLREAETAFSALALPHTPEEAAPLLALGADRMLDKARKALKRARGAGSAEAFHDLRKAIKYHRMHLSLLEGLKGGGTAARRRRTEELGEMLGELNDIDQLLSALAAEKEAIGTPTAVERLRKLLARQEKKLRKACIRKASALLDGRRKQLAARIEQRMRRAA